MTGAKQKISRGPGAIPPPCPPLGGPGKTNKKNLTDYLVWKVHHSVGLSKSWHISKGITKTIMVDFIIVLKN
jgi:hypothetical protein